MQKIIKILIVGIVSAFIISGCGGGGGGENSSNPTVSSADTFPLKQALVNRLYDTSTYDYVISGSLGDTAASGSGTYTNTTVSPTVFEGNSALKTSSRLNGSILMAGADISLVTSSIIFFDTNFNILGEENHHYLRNNSALSGDIGTEYSVVTSSNAIPESVSVSDTGVLYSMNTYDNRFKTVVSSTSTLSYAVEPDTAATAILKLITTDSDGDELFESFRMTTSGDLTKLTETETSSSISSIPTITYLNKRDPDTPPAGRKIFVTNAPHIGDFANDPLLLGNTPLEKADYFCTIDSNKPDDSNYKALLVDSEYRDATTLTGWVLEPNTTYYRPYDGAVIGTTNSESIFSNLTNGITEHFHSSPGNWAWTGIGDAVSFTTGENCNGWAANDSTSGDPGTITAASTAAFKSPGGAACRISLYVYCVEQPN